MTQTYLRELKYPLWNGLTEICQENKLTEQWKEECWIEVASQKGKHFFPPLML